MGSDADITLLDPRQEHVISAKTHHSRMDTNIYEGKRIRGKVLAVFTCVAIMADLSLVCRSVGYSCGWSEIGRGSSMSSHV